MRRAINRAGSAQASQLPFNPVLGLISHQPERAFKQECQHVRPHLDHLSRRDVIVGFPSLAATALFLTAPSPCVAAQPPEAYQTTARSLVSALRDSIDADLAGAPERELRRKADPAKDLVRQFMTRWRDAPEVQGEESYRQLTATIQDLGQFYLKQGQRARLSEELGQTLLNRLDAAELSLPPAPEKRSLLPF
jgi:hypothetical protein